MRLAGGILRHNQVAVFPTLAGVKLANRPLLLDSGIYDEECPTGEILGEPIEGDEGLLNRGGRMVICPLCWNLRDYAFPDEAFDGAVLNGDAVGKIFSAPGKSIDF